MKLLFRTIICFAVAMLITFFSAEYSPNANLLNALFTISGIMFAIGLGLIVNFLPEGVENYRFIQKIRLRVDNVRNKFLIEFLIVCLVYILSTISFFEQTIVVKRVSINFLVFFGLQLLFSIFYFVQNFLDIQKLKNDIFDRLREEKLQKLH